MEERLKLFLAMEGISPATLADRLGVQRSNISHLLAGRNKPSFEFINKLLIEYPKINPDWLILGKGKAYREDSSEGTEYPEKLPAAEPAPLPETRLDLGLFDQIMPEPQPSPDVSKAEAETQPAENPKTIGNPSPALPPQPAVEKEDTPEIRPSYPSESRTKRQTAPSPNVFSAPKTANRQIRQIVVFYTDGTYEVR